MYSVIYMVICIYMVYSVPVWLSGRANVSCAKGCGFDSQGTHILMNMYNMNGKSLWIKVSAKCINVNYNLLK